MRFRIKSLSSHDEVQLAGHVDEGVRQALEAIEAGVQSGRVVFDCAEVGKINSVGIKNWIAMFERFDQKLDTAYTKCPMAFVDVAMMVPSFAKGRPILSFYSCFHCEPCQIETPVLIELDDGEGVAPTPPPCQRCGQKMALDEDIEADLEFMRDRV
jgi:hypothetical protein